MIRQLATSLFILGAMLLVTDDVLAQPNRAEIEAARACGGRSRDSDEPKKPEDKDKDEKSSDVVKRPEKLAFTVDPSFFCIKTPSLWTNASRRPLNMVEH